MAEEEIKQKQEMEKRSNVKLVWILAGFLAAIIILGIFVYKYFNPEFKLTALFLWIFAIIIVLAALAGGFQLVIRRISKKKEVPEEEKMPKAITIQQAREYADKLLAEQYSDYFKTKPINMSALYGKTKRSSIYTAYGDGVYKNVKYLVLINQNYPLEKQAILEGVEEDEIHIHQNRLAIDPEDAPDTEEIHHRDELSGRETIIKKTIQQKNQEQTEKKEEEKKL